MAKKRATYSEKEYNRRVKEGRGKGTGKEYKPWITIHDFPSSGNVTRILGRTTGRIHHLLSGLESDYFLILDYNSEVVDIREQYPLLFEETVKLAQTMNIRHPRKPGELFPTVMTTDFLITLKNGKSIARSVKPSSDLENERVCKKLMLEREYWSRRGVDWKIVTEKEINRDMTMNLRWLYYGSEELPTEEYKRYETAFLECYQDKNLSFTTILEIIEEAFNLPHGTGMKIFRWMVLNEKITLDLQHPICLTEPRSFAQHSRRVY